MPKDELAAGGSEIVAAPLSRPAVSCAFALAFAANADHSELLSKLKLGSEVCGVSLARLLFRITYPPSLTTRLPALDNALALVKTSVPPLTVVPPA
jgi:hypothetical protein